VTRVKGSIGYVEYAYAKKNKIAHLKLQNRDGKFVDPDDTTFASAADRADWFGTLGMGISLVNQRGRKCMAHYRCQLYVHVSGSQKSCH
jgi:phosphate transport system substrate-binding protein